MRSAQHNTSIKLQLSSPQLKTTKKMTRTLLLFGAGPGIGDNVASTFASKGSIDHVVLLGRNTDRLTNEDVPFVQKAASNVKVDTLRADLSDLESIPKVLSQLDDLTKGEDIEVVYYNAARIKPTDPVLDVDVKEIDEDFRVGSCCCSLLGTKKLSD